MIVNFGLRFTTKKKKKEKVSKLVDHSTQDDKAILQKSVGPMGWKVVGTRLGDTKPEFAHSPPAIQTVDLQFDADVGRSSTMAPSARACKFTVPLHPFFDEYFAR